MLQDVALGVTTTITQADIPVLRAEGRLGEYAVVYRAYRQQQGGGFGDQSKHPFAWGVLVYVDTQLARVYSARGLPREWTDLTRLEKWMREQGFWYWWMRNDLEPLSLGSGDEEEDSDEAPAPAAPLPSAPVHLPDAGKMIHGGAPVSPDSALAPQQQEQQALRQTQDASD